MRQLPGRRALEGLPRLLQLASIHAADDDEEEGLLTSGLSAADKSVTRVARVPANIPHPGIQ